MHLMMLEKDKRSKKFWTPKSKRKAQSQSGGQSKLIYISCTKEKGTFGFSLSSGWPVVIENVFQGSPAYNSGLFIGDRILSVNGMVVDKFTSDQLSDAIQKISGQLDLCVERQGPAVIGGKLATFKSYIIIDGEFGGEVVNGSPRSRKSMALVDCDVRERKDSGTESGFLEIEAEFEDDLDRVLPDMFEHLPPLEQRRQRGIHDLVNDESNFLLNLNNYIEDLKALLMKLVLNNSFEKQFKKSETRVIKLHKTISDINSDVLEKRVKYSQPSMTKDGPNYYLDAIGYIYKQKIPEALSALNKIVKRNSVTNLTDETDTPDDGDKFQDVFLVLEGLVSYVHKYLTELRINMSHVLSCTPRKHKDHKPLREVIEELKKYKLEESTRKDGINTMKSKEKSKNQKLRRRFSWDNSSFRAFAQLSRTLSINTSTAKSYSPSTPSPTFRPRTESAVVSPLKNSNFPLWTLRRGDPACTQSLPRKFTLHDFRQSELEALSNSRQVKSKNNRDIKDRKLGTNPQPKYVVQSLQRERGQSRSLRLKDGFFSTTHQSRYTARQLAMDTQNQPPSDCTGSKDEFENKRGRSRSERVDNGHLVIDAFGRDVKRLSRSVEDLTFQSRRRSQRRRGETVGVLGENKINCDAGNVGLLDSDEDEDSILDKQIGRSLADQTIGNILTERENLRNDSVFTDENEKPTKPCDLHRDDGRNSCGDENINRLCPSPLSTSSDLCSKRSQSPADLTSLCSANINSRHGCNGEISPESCVDRVCKNQFESEETARLPLSSDSTLNFLDESQDESSTNDSSSSKDIRTSTPRSLKASSENTTRTKPLSSVSRIQQKLRERRKRHASLSDMFKAISPNSTGMGVGKNDSIDSLNSKQTRVRGDGAPDLTISTHFNKRVRDLLQNSPQGAGSSKLSIDDSCVRSPAARISPLTSHSTGNMAKFSLNRDTSRYNGRSVSLTPGLECRTGKLDDSTDKSATEMKVKTPGTYRRHTVSATENSALEIRRILSKKSRPSQADIKRWSDGIDCLLNDQRGIEIFRIFLRSEFSEENVLFWLACEELKQTRTYKLPIKAKKIFKTFIEIDSPYEVNIDHETRSQLEDCMKTPTRTMFDQAQRRIRYLMANDSYPRFLKSILYAELAK